MRKKQIDMWQEIVLVLIMSATGYALWGILGAIVLGVFFQLGKELGRYEIKSG